MRSMAAVEGEEEVGAGVAIRDGEDVECIDLGAARGEDGADEHGPAAHGIDVEDLRDRPARAAAARAAIRPPLSSSRPASRVERPGWTGCPSGPEVMSGRLLPRPDGRMQPPTRDGVLPVGGRLR